MIRVAHIFPCCDQNFYISLVPRKREDNEQTYYFSKKKVLTVTNTEDKETNTNRMQRNQVIVKNTNS